MKIVIIYLLIIATIINCKNTKKPIFGRSYHTPTRVINPIRTFPRVIQPYQQHIVRGARPYVPYYPSPSSYRTYFPSILRPYREVLSPYIVECSNICKPQYLSFTESYQVSCITDGFAQIIDNYCGIFDQARNYCFKYSNCNTFKSYISVSPPSALVLKKKHKLR